MGCWLELLIHFLTANLANFLGLSKTPHLASGLLHLGPRKARNTRKYFQAEPVFLTWFLDPTAAGLEFNTLASWLRGWEPRPRTPPRPRLLLLILGRIHRGYDLCGVAQDSVAGLARSRWRTSIDITSKVFQESRLPNRREPCLMIHLISRALLARNFLMFVEADVIKFESEVSGCSAGGLTYFVIDRPDSPFYSF